MRIHGCQMATSDSVKQHKLRKLIARLSDKVGPRKEFVSLYIPVGTSIDEIIKILREKSDSPSAKSERSANHVQEALKTIIQHLRSQQGISENGLAIFAGTYLWNDLEGEALSLEEFVPS